MSVVPGECGGIVPPRLAWGVSIIIWHPCAYPTLLGTELIGRPIAGTQPINGISIDRRTKIFTFGSWRVAISAARLMIGCVVAKRLAPVIVTMEKGRRTPDVILNRILRHKSRGITEQQCAPCCHNGKPTKLHNFCCAFSLLIWTSRIISPSFEHQGDEMCCMLVTISYLFVAVGIGKGGWRWQM